MVVEDGFLVFGAGEVELAAGLVDFAADEIEFGEGAVVVVEDVVSDGKDTVVVLQFVVGVYWFDLIPERAEGKFMFYSFEFGNRLLVISGVVIGDGEIESRVDVVGVLGELLLSIGDGLTPGSLFINQIG